METNLHYAEEYCLMEETNLRYRCPNQMKKIILVILMLNIVILTYQKTWLKTIPWIRKHQGETR
jgi:hypothetical protein